MGDSVCSQDGGGHRGPIRLSFACGQSRSPFENVWHGILSGCRPTLGRLGSLSVSAAAAEVEPAATAEPFTAALLEPLGPWRFGAVRFPFDVPDPLVGPSSDFSFWLVTVLEASDRESSMFRGRAGGMVGLEILGGKTGQQIQIKRCEIESEIQASASRHIGSADLEVRGASCTTSECDAFLLSQGHAQVQAKERHR